MEIRGCLFFSFAFSCNFFLQSQPQEHPMIYIDVPGGQDTKVFLLQCTAQPLFLRPAKSLSLLRIGNMSVGLSSDTRQTSLSDFSSLIFYLNDMHRVSAGTDDNVNTAQTQTPHAHLHANARSLARSIKSVYLSCAPQATESLWPFCFSFFFFISLLTYLVCLTFWIHRCPLILILETDWLNLFFSPHGAYLFICARAPSIK